VTSADFPLDSVRTVPPHFPKDNLSLRINIYRRLYRSDAIPCIVTVTVFVLCRE